MLIFERAGVQRSIKSPRPHYSQNIRPDVDNASTYHAETRASPKETSITRFRIKGPRSLIVTMIVRLLFGSVTRTRVPNGKVRCAAVKPLGSARAPLAALPPYE